jgi:hypothetical protein
MRRTPAVEACRAASRSRTARLLDGLVAVRRKLFAPPYLQNKKRAYHQAYENRVLRFF